MKKINLNIKLNFKIGIFTITSLFFLYLLYLSIPSLYDSGRVQKALYNNLVEEFGLNLSLSSEITYRILPKPHFHIKDSKIFRDKDKALEEIGEIKEVKLFISQKNFFKKENINIKQMVLSRGNFFFNRENSDYIIDLLKKDFSKKKIILKKSKLFFNDKSKTIIFIYTIDNLNFFKNEKENKQELKSKGEIFKIPVKFNWEKNITNKNTISNFKADKLDIEFVNKGTFLNESYNYENNFKILTNSFRTNYKFFGDSIHLESKKSLIKNTPIKYSGKIDLSPFSFKLALNVKSINVENFFKNNVLINGIISSNILLNENINGIIEIKTNKLIKNKLFDNANISINFEEGNIHINNSYAINNKFGKIVIENTEFKLFNNRSDLVGEVRLEIYDHNQFYKFFPVAKKKRSKRLFNKIKFNFIFNLNDTEFSIDRVNFLDKNNKIIQSKKVDDFVEDNYDTRFKFSNKVLFKNFIKSAVITYLDEG